MEMCQPDPDAIREIDIKKVDLVSSYRTTSLFAWIGIYLGFAIGLDLAFYQQYANAGIVYYVGLGLITGFIGALAVTQEVLPYRDHVNQVEKWLIAIERGEQLPAFGAMMRARNRLKPFGHAILIVLVLVEWLLIFLRMLSWENVLIFFAIGVAVTILTQRGTVGEAKPGPPVDPTSRTRLLQRLGSSMFAAVSLLSGIALGNYVGTINGWSIIVLSVLLVGFLYVLPLAWFVRSKRKQRGAHIGAFSISVIKISNWFVQGVFAGEVYDLAYEAFVLEPKVTTALAFILGIVTIIGSFVLVVLTMFLLKTVEEDFLIPFSPTASAQGS